MNSVSAPNVFMRSMATRTANTSVSASVKDSIHALQAAGFDLVILETAGIGQWFRSRGLVRSFPLRHDARIRCAEPTRKNRHVGFC